VSWPWPLATYRQVWLPWRPARKHFTSPELWRVWQGMRCVRDQPILCKVNVLSQKTKIANFFKKLPYIFASGFYSQEK